MQKRKTKPGHGNKNIKPYKVAGILGLLATSIFSLALLIFGLLHPNFSFLDDFVSKLGAIGEPLAIGWNLIGFVLVGIFLIGFGFLYGKTIHDTLTGILLSLFGLGFALTAIPIDFDLSESPVSKAHIVAICLALAAWLFGLARMGALQSLSKGVKRRANIAAILLVSAMLGFVLGFWSMPLTHRMVFGIVFGWTGITALDLLMKKHPQQTSP